MKKTLFIFLLYVAAMANAGVTTYTFTSKSWNSKVGASICDGVTDGWTSDKDAYNYSSGTIYADGSLHGAGASVKTGTSGAGATSVVSFTNVRQIRFNFCQNASSGKGVIYAQVGNNPYDSIVVNAPAKSMGHVMRDSVIRLLTPLSGQIKFWITCTDNAININNISIRAEEGGTSLFTQANYQLVTNVSQLEDSDQIIIAVPSAGKVMGYFDESVSQNNIHAINGRFSSDLSMVDADDRAIYTLRKSEIGNGVECFYIQDEIRYEEAYLVASGGQSKNRLALWDKLYDANSYGNYGYWSIQVAADGDATIMNLGNSLGKYLQYNASNSPTLFGCYATQGSQTAVKIYRRVEALGNIPAIVAPLVNFGTMVLDGANVSKNQTISVSANRLGTDISVSVDNPMFSVASSLLDRDGDDLTITCTATAAGHYSATISFTSDTVHAQTTVLATVAEQKTVAQAVGETDFSVVYLKPVWVTKKYDHYIFVRDSTGSMLLYDNGDGSGKRYGADLKQGDMLQNVSGRFQNYYGVPELALIGKLTSSSGSAEADIVMEMPDSADVCRYVQLDSVQVSRSSGRYWVDWKGREIPLEDHFDVGINEGYWDKLTAIVMISWNEVQLWLVSQTRNDTDLNAIDVVSADGKICKILRNGRLLILTPEGVFDARGVKLK